MDNWFTEEVRERLKRKELLLKAARRNKSAKLCHLWDLIYPIEHRYFLIQALDCGQSKELVEKLTNEQRIELWKEISNDFLGRVMVANSDMIKGILEELSPERRKAFFCCLTPETTNAAYGVFMAIEDKELQKQLIKEYPEILEAFLDLTVIQQKTDDFLWVLEGFDEQFGVFIIHQIVNLDLNLLAGVLQLASEKLTRRIVENMKQDDILPVCVNIPDQKLYDVLVKSDFLLITRGDNFPITKLNKEERVAVFLVLKTKVPAFKRFFSEENIAELYTALPCRTDKAEFLRSYVDLYGDLGDFLKLYACLPESERHDMLEMLMSEELDFPSGVQFILNERIQNGEKLDFWEQMLHDKFELEKKLHSEETES